MEVMKFVVRRQVEDINYTIQQSNLKEETDFIGWIQG